MKTKYRASAYLLLVIVVACVLYASLYYPQFSDLLYPQTIRSSILNAGQAGIVLFFALVALSVVLPLPNSPIIIAGGYVYGMWISAIIALVASTIGGYVAFKLVRKFGRPLLDHFVDPKHIDHFYKIFRKRGATAVLLFYALPILPSDAMSFLLGLTKMRSRTFFMLILTGSIPRMLILALFGESLHEGISQKTIVLALCIALFLIATIFRSPIRRFIIKEAQMVEGELNELFS